MTLSEEERNALVDERRKLMDEYHSPKVIRDAREEISRLVNLMREADPVVAGAIHEHVQTINFLVGETFGGDMGEDTYEYALDEINALEKLIENIVMEKHETAGDIWAQYPAARRNLLSLQVDMRDESYLIPIQQRILEIEHMLNPETVIQKKETDEGEVEFILDDDDVRPMHQYFIPPTAVWNNAIRRIEYFNYDAQDALPSIDLEPWDWTWKQWKEYEANELEEYSEELPPELWSDPIEDKNHEIDQLRTEVEWLKVQLNREDRMTSEFKTESEDRFKSMNETISAYNAKRFPPQKHWHPSTEENIETLKKMGLEGNTVEVLFNPRDKHVQRDLIVRWGIDVGYATRVPFKVLHHSHMNNFFGKLDGYPNTTVLLGLQLDRQNKVRVKTALRPMSEADDYLALERKHLPGGVGYSAYSRQDLITAHRKIMAELHGKKGPER